MIEINMRVVTQLMTKSSTLTHRTLPGYEALPKPRIRLNFGLKYYFREARLQYLYSEASKFGIIKEAVKLVLYDFRFRFKHTIVFLFICSVYEFDGEKDVRINFFSSYPDEEIWISRQAILGGIKSRHLDESIGYNFLRNILKVKIRVWETSQSMKLFESKANPPLSEKVEVLKLYQFEPKGLQLKPVTFSNAKIHHGKFVTLNSSIIPISYEQSNPSSSWPTDSYVKSASNFYVVKSNETLKLPKAIFIGDSSNWYHLLIEYLPRYLTIPTKIRSVPAIISKRAPKQFITLLGLLGFTNLVFCDLLEAIKVDKLVSILDFRFKNAYDFRVRREDLLYLQSVFQNLEIPKEKVNAQKRIIILRPENTFRRMQNENELIQKLEVLGFQAICPERLSFIEQFLIFRSAEIVVGQSGAALTSLLFCKQDAQIFELGDWEKTHEQYFWRMFASELGLTITAIYSQPKTLRQKIDGRFQCDIVSLMAQLAKSS